MKKQLNSSKITKQLSRLDSSGGFSEEISYSLDWANRNPIYMVRS